jgi:ferredoxin
MNIETKYYTISRPDLFDLLGRLAKNAKVLVPYAKKDGYFFGEFDPAKEASIELGGIRQSQPVKSFLSAARETVCGRTEKKTRPLIIAGVKGCDLQSFTLQDFVFLEGDFKDPFYIESRNNTTIIAHDCTYAKETCFCLAMEGAPYPMAHFDMSLSPLYDQLLVEVSTEKGAAIVRTYKTFFRDADKSAIEARSALREKVSAEIKGFIERRGTQGTSSIKGAVKNNYNNVTLWQDFSATCVECGACNFACPTCHCFLLFDGSFPQNESRRMRIWDSCLYNTFARVAGGANPRKHLFERLRNRFDKKFAFFPQVLNYFACTGCGRCIEACPGDIDIREVLKGLVKGSWKRPPHD